MIEETLTKYPGTMAFPIIGALATVMLLLFGAPWYITIAPAITGVIVVIVLVYLFLKAERPKEEVQE